MAGVADAERIIRSPDQCPAKYLPEVSLLHRNTRSIMDAKALPYYVQAQIASKGYLSVEDVADLYDSPRRPE